MATDVNGASDLKANPLSSRLTAVLSTSYADVDIRQALETLDERHFVNAPENRRQLRLDVQKELIDCNGDIVKEFGNVAEQLKRVGAVISRLSDTYESMRGCVAAARQETAPVLEDAAVLLERKGQVEQKQKLLVAFNKHFLLSEEELATLASSAEPVDERFFAALERTKAIHKDCEILLGLENQRLGLEIMEQCASNLNSAYQKLFRWIQHEFKSLNLEDPHINASIRRALPILAERPTLFQDCLDAFAETRQSVLAEAFYSALTEGGSSNAQQQSTKPIEFFTHDPLRYVGDMLAWTHSAAVSEREALEGLFIAEHDEFARGFKTGMDSEPWARKEGDTNSVFDGHKALADLVNQDLAGIERILRQRIGQVIQTQDEALIQYKLLNLVSFYRITFSKLLGAEHELGIMLLALEESAFKQFRTAMQDQVVALDFARPSSDLSVPGFFEEALEQLNSLMKTYDTSLIPAEIRRQDFRSILAEALDPFLTGCEQSARGLKHPDNSIFIINCLLAAKSALLAFDFTIDRLAEIEKSIDEQVTKLINSQHAFFLDNSGLKVLIEALRSCFPEGQLDYEKPPSGEDARHVRELQPFQPKNLSSVSQDLDDFLPSALMDATENLQKLNSPTTVKGITDKAAQKFCEDFEFVEACIIAADEAGTDDQGEQVSEENRHVDPDMEVPAASLRALFPRTSGEIRVLLS